MSTDKEKFLCPECGSTQAGDTVLERIYCTSCGRAIPAHIAYLWDDLSEEEARKEWRAKYRSHGVG
jgi:predicted RNA-binding Zn-ribbon protein involved in translation (DUF1610 family)